jgi:ribosomal protein L19E
MVKFPDMIEARRVEAARLARRDPCDRFDIGRLRDYEQLAEEIPRLQRAMAEGDVDRVARLAFVVGELNQRAELRYYSAELDTGQKVRRGGKVGALKQHGGAGTKMPKHEEWTSHYRKLRIAKPKLGHVAATNLTGTHFGVSGRTVRKHVENPSC